MRNLTLALLISIFVVNQAWSQVYSDKVAGKKNQDHADSLKKAEYPYLLPIWGQKVTQKGFTLPYSAGLSLNYFGQESDLIIDNLSVGFNNGQMYNLEEIVRFKSAVSTAQSINLRPDFWIFPFLNVYGIFAKAKTSTAIDAGLWLPDTANNWNEITAFSSKADFDAVTTGFGMTPTVGVAGCFLALDMNMAWTSISAIEKPVFSFVFGPRLGKSFKFKNPNRNISIWAGGFRVSMSSETNGSLNLAEVLPVDELQGKVDDGMAKVDEAENNVNAWWEGLTEQEQNNPVNQAKYETANNVIDATGNIMTALDGALSTASTSTVQYSLTKKPKDMWNFVVGSQFQLNRHFMFRAEYGFLSSRQQLTLGLQYRFGL
jgi:hypothetical protein